VTRKAPKRLARRDGMTREVIGMGLAGHAHFMNPRLEQERPSEFLRWLAEEPDGYRLLVEHAGGLARAAYRVASARCRAHGGMGVTPTLRELQAAAHGIAQALGVLETLPITSLLANDCEAQGLLLIRPLRRAS
jgi:hypothetical protein